MPAGLAPQGDPKHRPCRIRSLCGFQGIERILQHQRFRRGGTQRFCGFHVDVRFVLAGGQLAGGENGGEKADQTGACQRRVTWLRGEEVAAAMGILFVLRNFRSA